MGYEGEFRRPLIEILCVLQIYKLEFELIKHKQRLTGAE